MVEKIIVWGLFIWLIASLSYGKISRVLIGISIIATLLLSGLLSPIDLLYVNWDVILLILLMGLFTNYMEESGLAKLVGYSLIARTGGGMKLYYVLILASGIVSLFLDNVSTVLIFLPIAFQIAGLTAIDPRPLIIGMALSANMSGSATMIGDPPAMIVAGEFRLGFLDFFFYNGKPSMFFITFIPMVFATLAHVFANLRVKSAIELDRIERPEVDRVFAYEVAALLLVEIFILSTRNIHELPLSVAPLIALAGIALVRLLHRDIDGIVKAARRGVEWRPLVLLISVFLLSIAFERYGVAHDIAAAILSAEWGLAGAMTLLYAISALLSSFLDNIPITVTLIPVVRSLAREMGGDPVPLMFAALAGLTAGGNYTYVGASANLAALTALEKRGIKTSLGDFVRASLAFNAVNTVMAYALLMYFFAH